MTRRSILKAAVLICSGLVLPAFSKKNYTNQVLSYRCVNCLDCKRVCRMDAIKIVRGKAVIDPDACTACGMCEAVCTYGAIERCEKE